MSSIEIEDVLSSIRRLVSEDLRPNAVQAAAVTAPPAPAVSVTEAAPKLLLTPALRVVQADAGQGAAADADPAQDWDEAPFHGDVPLGTFDDADPPAPLVLGAAAVMPVHDPLPEADEAVPATDAASVWQDHDAAEQVDAIAAQTLPEELAEETGHQDIDLPSDTDWADAAEAEVLRQLAVDAELSAARRLTLGVSGAPEAVYEEDVLRDLVRDIINEELQGPLGERITRNVRKLVRAEIARALALRDFE